MKTATEEKVQSGGANEQTPAPEAVQTKGAEATAPGQNTCHAKNTVRFTITPTTAAVIAVRGAVRGSVMWESALMRMPPTASAPNLIDGSP